MKNSSCQIRYTQLAVDDLSAIVSYVAGELKNPIAARKIIGKIRLAIEKRANYPTVFAVVPTRKKRTYAYYRIYVDNYDVYYVVVENIMEIRRVHYNKRNYDALLKKD